MEPYRTSPARVGKMMGIMLGICVVGGGIFFGMWDYWISELPPVATSGAVAAEPAGPLTGDSVSFDLDFVESSDFITLGFDGLPDEPGSNPTLTVASGDEVTVSVTNTGVTFHAFGVTADPDDFAGTLWGSDIGSAANPLKGGESGTATFIAGAPGEYYYICTVPGHALQGMVGSFVVE